ncbi:MAG: TonB family protein [Acidobacteriaceae bacterium]|nr:TonB family protein [Acidobacteriaceae bacterium]
MGWSVWIDLFIRSAILLAGGEALRRISCRATADGRHKLVLLVFAFLAMLPLSTALMPALQIPLWFSHSGTGTVSENTATFLTTGVEKDMPRSPIENWLFVIWLSGLLMVMTSLGAGRLFLWRVSRRALPVRDARWRSLLSEICSQNSLNKEPQLLALSGLRMPLAFGARRGTILLPGDCAEWSDLRKRVVLLHELAHVQRRDIAAQFFANMISAVWWFQPLVWMARRTLRRESEQACDAQAIARGVRPSDYAAELIEIARCAGSGGLWSRAAMSMARSRDLEGRLIRVLNASSPRPESSLSYAVATLAAIALTASALTLSSEQKIPQPGGLVMKRTLISGLVASVGLSAATITGSVFDPSGASVPDAKVLLYNPDTSMKRESASALNGKFAFDALPAGQYILRVEKSGFALLLREFTLQPDSNVERSFNMQVGSGQEEVNVEAKGEPAEASPSTEPKPTRVGGSVMQSKLVTRVNPVYPATAKAAGIQGTVLLETVILKDGTAGEITVTSSPNDDLSQASLEAVRQWRWSPVLLNGQPIEVVTQVRINYTLAP